MLTIQYGNHVRFDFYKEILGQDTRRLSEFLNWNVSDALSIEGTGHV